MDARGSTAVRGALAGAVGLVLADSSVVVLALPEIYRELDVSVSAVTWVLVAFNLVLAVAAVLSGWFPRAPLLLWVAISYVVQLVVDTRYALQASALEK